MHLCFFAVPESGELVGSICFLLSTTWISASEQSFTTHRFYFFHVRSRPKFTQQKLKRKAEFYHACKIGALYFLYPSLSLSVYLSLSSCLYLSLSVYLFIYTFFFLFFWISTLSHSDVLLSYLFGGEVLNFH